MPTILTAQRRIDPVASTASVARMDETLQLSARTVAWLADHVHARKLIRSVSDILGELQQAGHHPGAIAVLRHILSRHQPTSTGRCRTCRRWIWRRPPFPCIVWHQVRRELLGRLPTPTVPLDDLPVRPAVRWWDTAAAPVPSVGGDRHGQARHQRGRTVE
jgi:hypothetical protein